ncbi:MAG: V-type ATP synthase subunit F [Lachnospiraceae bacterium]|mgnify:CR=1 FL=1
MKSYLISDNVDTATGMRLAGIEGEVVHERDELTDAINRAAKDKDTGIIFITELLTQKYPDVVGNAKENLKNTLILEIPDRHGSTRRADFITAYINEAIGVKL